jgi:N-acetylmuramoyl-L-alanine amidase
MADWRIHIHWTAGAPGIIPIEQDSYNFIVDGKGGWHKGDFPPEAQTPENVRKGSNYYAAHTLSANSYAIGVALDAMGGAQERPFKAGANPITPEQLQGAVKGIAELARKWRIPVTRTRILTHAEVQRTLGIKQRNKWDIMWIPGMDKPGDPIVVGDQIRAMIAKEM